MLKFKPALQLRIYFTTEVSIVLNLKSEIPIANFHNFDTFIFSESELPHTESCANQVESELPHTESCANQVDQQGKFHKSLLNP